ncbi:MAG: hypothetical protein IAI50_10995, partial [Candidatus Eremiobacteraeota bacterium]|nr:hypothetical protein [Candidatus Eremiobacteraeota bacterium]
MALAQSAQDAPPPGSPDGGPPAGMPQMRAQTVQLRMETRSQMLAALTPQHLTLLGNVIGRLATSPTPDLQAAAQQLDSALSPR